MPASSVDDVIDSLETIIEWSKQNESKLGYFPALYCKVTRRVKDGINRNEFHDGDRMEKFDVIFANRYLTAFEKYHNQGYPVRAWDHTFDATRRWKPIILQHLMLGMNAHINLDLGIAAAETADSVGDSLQDMEHDFFLITDILIEMIDHVQNEISRVWPMMGLLDRIAGEKDELIAAFGLDVSRNRAWKTARALANLSGDRREHTIGKLDRNVRNLGKLLLSNGPIFGMLLFIARLGEMRSVSGTIEVLE
ncbi:MAG: hypothetical protein GF372_08095 [Candidatus Marinimicrobia bacterium]|nr:hypothetical protein [Candidatus Neomarinimicrobiota bacterium]